jgi:hypothetical protein
MLYRLAYLPSRYGPYYKETLEIIIISNYL